MNIRLYTNDSVLIEISEINCKNKFTFLNNLEKNINIKVS